MNLTLSSRISQLAVCATLFLGAFQIGTAQAPSDLMRNCNQWKITYPDGVEEKQLCGESNEFFYVNNSGDAIVFRAPIRSDNGTTPNSSYIRSELREREVDGSKDIYWTTEGSHMIYVKQAITHLPITKSHLVATQIHGNKADGIDDSMVMRLENSHLFLSFNGGKLRDDVTIKTDYNLGDIHEVIFLVEDGKHYCYYAEDGNLLNAFNSGNASSYLVRADGNDYVMDLNYDQTYFKVGNYTQSNPEREGDNTDDPDNYGEVLVYDFLVDHGDGGGSTDPIDVTGVSLNPSSVSLAIGGTQELSASVSPSDASNKSVSYSSNNNAVASVSSTGVVTAHSEGSATITVTTSDGNYTDSTNVTVLEASNPSDDTNLALNKYVSGTGSADGSNVVANLVDGDTGTRWSVSGFPQSATIDLGAVQNIGSTELVCYSDRAYQYTIEVSENGSSYTEVVDRTNNSTPGSASSPIIDAFDSVDARYVKITVTGADAYTGSWVSLLELAVFPGDGSDNGGGDNGGGPTPESTNVALGKSVTFSSQQSHNPASNLVDGDEDSRWSAESYPEWTVIDLGGLYTVNSTEVICFGDRAYQYTIEVSEDGSSYTEVVDRTNNSTGGSNSSPIADSFSEIDARYVRITVTGADDYSGDWISIEELRVFGYSSTATSKSGASKGANVNDSVEAVSFWPNPAANTVNINGASNYETLTVFDLTGKVVLNQAIQSPSVDISNLNSGMYIFRLEGKSGAVNKRIIKK
ncbi:discoidin domain-containing protein [Tamlana sp. s12]|uniref:discoidin domain-containing protein n=1 Tax=Tamlana sp. s12 TaxID=1630406 RepID=UPI0007FDF3B9|nr:discoidin domain-containing protein [Tamlana sp. s12]OBQ55875.1 hypothetical protein VQ01_05620 [Tamlana sp. s12]